LSTERWLSWTSLKVAVAFWGLIFALSRLFAQLPSSQELFHLPKQVESVWASPENPNGQRGQGARENGGRKGRASVPLPAGQQLVLAEVSGRSGTVRRIWLTMDDRTPRMLRSLRIDVYWDGAPTPAVSSPLGDFFGVGLGRTTSFASALFTSPEGRSFNSYAPMPFRTGMKIVVTNESHSDLKMLYYDVDYTLGDQHGADTLYFHAYFRRENPTTLQNDYEVLPHIKGMGRYLGANFGVIPDQNLYPNQWWGEGEVKIYLDGDLDLPSLVGTGTEDYTGTGWGEGPYAHLYQGCPIVDKNRAYCFYRYHIPDPIYFRREIRVTIQQIGHIKTQPPMVGKLPEPLYRAVPGLQPFEGKQTGYFERQDDWSSCVYFYLDKPENGLPPLQPVERRTAGL
jgi:hypothetical protein